MTPSLTPEKKNGYPLDDGCEDPAIDLDDNEFMNPPLAPDGD
jgi:hypothetical protein